MTIDILMATYNGASFIEEQILSLIRQTHNDWILYIHDDGSIDNTIEIIKKYAIKDDRIYLIEDGIKCGGAAKNFLHLLDFSKSEYIIFCDQDDIWLEEKLELLYNQISFEKGACAVYCNAFAYDGKEIISDKVTLYNRTNLENSLFLNSGVQGCSLMFNRALLNYLKELPDYVYMHDHLITIASVTFGKLKHIEDSLMLYRQHNENVTGNIVLGLERLKMFFFGGKPVLDEKHYNANVAFYRKYQERIEDGKKELFKAYFHYPKQNLLNKIITINKYKFIIGNSKLILIVKTIIRKPI